MRWPPSRPEPGRICGGLPSALNRAGYAVAVLPALKPDRMDTQKKNE